jgi:hypothetical protein
VTVAIMAAACALGVIAGLVYLTRVRDQLPSGDEPGLTPEPAPAR